MSSQGREGNKKEERGKEKGKKEGRRRETQGGRGELESVFLCGDNFSRRDMCLPVSNWLTSHISFTCQDAIGFPNL